MSFTSALTRRSFCAAQVRQAAGVIAGLGWLSSRASDAGSGRSAVAAEPAVQQDPPLRPTDSSKLSNAAESLVSPFTPEQARTAQRAWARRLGADVILSNRVGMKFALIPPGEFLMGTTADDPTGDADQRPQHRVRITKPFFLGVYEVTQAEWQTVMETHRSWFSASGSGSDQVANIDTKRFPAEFVSFDDAQALCRKLSERDRMEGKSYRLPTEAEWEYACRAGTTTPYHFGGTFNGQQGNADGRIPYGTTEKGPYLKRSTTVGSYAANAFGLHDMHGNVCEWCIDSYARDYYMQSPVEDPINQQPSETRVLRGGAMEDVAANCRSASRSRWSTAIRSYLFGVRLVCVLQ